MLHLCKSLLKNEADAADAAQEAMQKVFTRAHQYDPTRHALPWALAIAAWECRTVQLCARHLVDGTPRQVADGHEGGVREARGVMRFEGERALRAISMGRRARPLMAFRMAFEKRAA